MKGTSGAESDNLMHVSREKFDYLEEDNISLLIKDMDEKEVCRIILRCRLPMYTLFTKFRS